MARYLALGASALLFVGAAFFFWKGQADATDPVPPAPMAESRSGDLPEPPRADERTRERRRFDRYDKDRNSSITREEYLASRRKAYAKLDIDGDRRLSFDEWAVRTTTKFDEADADRSEAMSPEEFWTTRVIRKIRPKPDCPPVRMES